MALNKPTGDMLNAGSNATPAALGTASAGTSVSYSRGDHVHAKPSAADIGALGATEAMGGDLSGNMPTPTVAKISGQLLAGTAPTSGQVLTWNGSAWAPATASTGGGGGANGLTYYFNQATAADTPTTNLFAGVKQLGRTAEVGQTTVTSGTLTANAWQIVAAFVSESSPVDPNVTSIPAGLWDFAVWASSDANSNAPTSIRALVFKYDAANGLTNLAVSGSQIIGTSSAQYALSVVVPQTALTQTDRIYVTLQAQATASGHTVSMQFGDSTPSHVNTSLSLVGGTGLWHSVAGVLQPNASLLTNADVDAAAAIAWSKIAPTFGTTAGTACEGNDVRLNGLGYGNRVKIVGKDASTIQGCIDLCTDASYTNQYQIIIPPGFYVENLTLKPSVSLSGSGFSDGLNSMVKISGTHTFTGTSVVADNIIELCGLNISGLANGTTLTFATTGTTVVNAIIRNCLMINSGNAAVGVYVPANVLVQCYGSEFQGYGGGGGTGNHFDVNGGSLYLFDCRAYYGNRVILMRGTNGALKPFVQVFNSVLSCGGTEVVKITSTTALFTAGHTNFENLSATGNGIDLQGAGTLIGLFCCSFQVPYNAGASYVITGVAGTYAAVNTISYSAVPAFGISYSTSIGGSVTVSDYSARVPNIDASVITTGTLAVARGGTGVTTSSGTGAVMLNQNPTIKGSTDQVTAAGVVGATKTLDISAANIVTATLTASTATTFTMPTATAGKTFKLYLKQPAATGNGSATFTGVKWPAGSAPTITVTAGRMDVLQFHADGTNWYGNVVGQNYTY